jgi:uracil-DNA glycosylase
MAEREEILHDLLEHARHLQTLTEIGLPRSAAPPAIQASASPVSSPAPVAVSAPPAPVLTPTPVPRPPRAAPSDGPADLDAVRAWIGDCQRCKLAGGRQNIVFGQGSPTADLMFVGEAPGADEDEQGLAFVGRAGQLLTKIIEAIGLQRSDVFIANVLKCRPPNNRNPEPDEILSCQPFLERQIELIQPKVLVGLGKFGGQWLLKTAAPISKIRGRVGDYNGIKVVPTYHPAFLLRNPSAKKEVWEDMKLVRSLLQE